MVLKLGVSTVHTYIRTERSQFLRLQCCVYGFVSNGRRIVDASLHRGTPRHIVNPPASKLRTEVLSSDVILPIIVTNIEIKAQTARSRFGIGPSSFKVRTVLPAAERPVGSLNSDRENGQTHTVATSSSQVRCSQQTPRERRGIKQRCSRAAYAL